MPWVPADTTTTEMPETAALWLPSSFPKPRHSVPPSMIALPRLREVEAELHFAHAKDALDSLHQHLLVQVHITKYTRSNVRGQSSNTRSQSLLQQGSTKIRSTAAQYRHIRAAYLSLKGPGD